MTFINYIPFYYNSIAGAAIPPIIAGKFVQIRNGNELYLVFSPKEFTKYHANIVERFCMDKGVEGSYDAKREKFTIADTAWRIIGGGRFELDSLQKTIRLHDDSMAYGKFETSGLAELLTSLVEYSGFTVRVE